jgi:P27 family predicted phage terminase small subunit
MSRRPTATILKLIKGDNHVERHKSDAPKIDGLPLLPPGTVLSDAERAIWDHLMLHAVMPGVHGTADGAAFAKICKLQARVNEADAKCAQYGLVMKSDKGKPELQPYARLSRDLWQQLGIAFAEVGMTPAGRVKIAGPRSATRAGEATSWDEID